MSIGKEIGSENEAPSDPKRSETRQLTLDSDPASPIPDEDFTFPEGGLQA